MQLRPYQEIVAQDVAKAWRDGARVVLAQLPTGGGKTVIFSRFLRDESGQAVAVAHRQELVGQISLSLARFGVTHKIMAPKNVVHWIIAQQVAELGRSYYSQTAAVTVAGVDTIRARAEKVQAWGRRVTLWVIDEGHHILKSNKWGAALQYFPNARGLAVTATPERADGKGLGDHADGFIDRLVLGPSGRDLIDAGYLSDYRIFSPPSDLRLDDVKVGSTGDFVQHGLTLAVRRSHIIGDVVAHYLRIARGKLGVTFATDIETAKDITDQYKAAGVAAELVTANTPDTLRADILRRFRRREIVQVVNVDLFGEGFDLPALEVVSMARPTQSFPLYAQQFGRALRPMEGKDRAIIIDHVGNVVRHGLPDEPRAYSLDRREARRSAELGTIPIRICPKCTGAYKGIAKLCPYCGHAPEPAQRTAPHFVDGDLTELDAEALARLRGRAAVVDGPFRGLGPGAAPLAVLGAEKAHRLRQQAQGALRAEIDQWAGYQRAEGVEDPESFRRFYFLFGVDVLSAMAYGRPDAEDLSARVRAENEKLKGAKCKGNPKS